MLWGLSKCRPRPNPTASSAVLNENLEDVTMNSSKKILAAAAVVASTMALAPAANAEVRGVSVTKGKGWVSVNIRAAGGFKVHELPVGTAAYRSIAVDIPGYIAGGLEPKGKTPVNEGLVGQVRVKQLGGMVRVYIDVLSFPKYSYGFHDGAFHVDIDSYHMRNGDALKPSR